VNKWIIVLLLVVVLLSAVTWTVMNSQPNPAPSDGSVRVSFVVLPEEKPVTEPGVIPNGSNG